MCIGGGGSKGGFISKAINPVSVLPKPLQIVANPGGAAQSKVAKAVGGDSSFLTGVLAPEDVVKRKTFLGD